MSSTDYLFVPLEILCGGMDLGQHWLGGDLWPDNTRPLPELSSTPDRWRLGISYIKIMAKSPTQQVLPSLPGTNGLIEDLRQRPKIQPFIQERR